MTVLLTAIKWVLSYCLNACSFMWIGKQHEENKQLKGQLEAISKANIARDKLKSDPSIRDKLRKRFTR